MRSSICSHGIRASMRSRNISRRVLRFLLSYSKSANVGWSINYLPEHSAQIIGITVRDAANNGGTLGTGTGDPTAAAALDFEIDTGLAAAVTTPATGDKSEGSALFLFEIDWTAESDGTEYSGDTQASVSLDKAELDGVNVLKLAAANSTGDRWTIAVPRLAVGSHTLTFNGSDALGNTMALDASVTFEVTQRLLYAMALQPDLNLISLPATPATPGINDIFGSSDVSLVFTYDPVDPRGPWLFASRTDISQPFAGDLTTIDARHAYFVSTTARVTLLVDIPVQSPVLFVPPTISVRTGWNLVPVSDITQRAFATPIAANSYLGATGWSRALTYDLNPLTAGATGPWVVVTPGDVPLPIPIVLGTTFGGVRIGFGYWVWFNAPSLIIP